MSEQFKVSMLKDEMKIYSEFIDIPVPVVINGEEKELNIKAYPYFKPEAIRDCVNEIAEFFTKAKEEKLNIPKIEEDDVIGAFICKYFTDMKFTSSKKAKTIYNEFKLLINSKLYRVITKAFPQESIDQLYERIFEIIEVNATLENKVKQKQQEIKDLPLENRDILFPAKEKQIPEV